MTSVLTPARTERTPTKHRFLRGLLGVTALGWAVSGLLLALMSVLPTPNLRLLWPNLVLDLIAMIVQESSLLLTAFALLGLGLALVARRVGLRRTWRWAEVLGVVTVALSLVPVVQGWRTASQEGVPLSLSEYFSQPAVGSPETVLYARPEGEELELDLWRPRSPGDSGEPNRPAVVMVHGGGGEYGGRGHEALWSGWLAEQGHIVFSVDYRLGMPPRWQDAASDVKCAVGWVKENADRYGVDPDRVALMGRSFGGFLALLAAYTEGDPRLAPSCDVPDTGVQAVAAFYPATDLTRTGDSQGSWWRPSLGNSVKDSTGADVDFVAEGEQRLASPVFHVDAADPPTFLAHGGADQWASPEQSALLANRLEDAGVPYRLVRLPWARHAFDTVWGGWDTQVVRHELQAFWGTRLAAQESGER